MAASLSVLAWLALASGSAAPDRNLDDESLSFANTLVTSYSCDLLGYDVDFIGLTDRGHDIREAMIEAGATPEQAMERIQSHVRLARARFNKTYASAFIFHASVGADTNSAGTDPLYRFMKTLTKRCNELAEARETSALFIAPNERMSGAEVSRKIRMLAMRTR